MCSESFRGEGSQFHQGSFSRGLSCGPILFLPIFVRGFQIFPPRQKSNASWFYIFLGAPPELLGHPVPLTNFV
jgi:hypothetical protein